MVSRKKIIYVYFELTYLLLLVLPPTHSLEIQEIVQLLASLGKLYLSLFIVQQNLIVVVFVSSSGYGITAGDTTCSQCLAGFFSAGGSSDCQQCSGSTFSASAGANSCTPCGTGGVPNSEFTDCTYVNPVVSW